MMTSRLVACGQKICAAGNEAIRYLPQSRCGFSQARAAFVVVLQADLLKEFHTVVVAPILTKTTASKISRLNPVIKIDGKTYRVSTSELASVLRSQLDDVIANFENQHREFVDAIDLLFTGI